MQSCLAGAAPIVAVSDWVCAWPQSIAPYLDAPFTALGSDGFGRSDTRAQLRRFFEIDREHIVLAALTALSALAQPAARGGIDATTCQAALARYGINAEADAPWLC